MSAPEPFCRCKGDDTEGPRDACGTAARSRAETAAALNAVQREGRPDRRRGHDVAATAGKCGRRERRDLRPSPATPRSSSRLAIASASSIALLTNFHLPRSTLFMLVSAFSGLDTMRAAYAHAIAQRLSLLFLWRCLPAESGGRHDDERSLSLSRDRTDGAARTGEIATPRGTIRTPAFMPVGTGATVKAHVPRAGARRRRRHHPRQHLSSDAASRRRAHRASSAACISFMHWDGPILTDSGGYQVMSLAKLRKIDEDGVTFQSHIDGAQRRR